MKATLHSALQPQWRALEPLHLGAFAKGRAPDRYVIVEGGAGVLRCDLIPTGAECYAFEAAEIWHGLLLVGYGCHLYVVDLATRAVREPHHFDSYFGHIYAALDYCLVASGHSLYRLGGGGEYLWASRGLGLDGVVVHDVTDGVIRGDGEWDPPGGWQPFSVRLSDGSAVSQDC